MVQKVLVISNYVPKQKFNYPEVNCPIMHRKLAHEKIFQLQRFFPQKLDIEILKVEKCDFITLKNKIFDPRYELIILSGSPFSVYEKIFWIQNLKKSIQCFYEAAIPTPMFGICFGIQIITEALGGEIGQLKFLRKGKVEMEDVGKKIIHTRVFHQDYVLKIPQKSEIIATGPEGNPYVIKFSKNIWACQPHLEFLLENLEENEIADVFWRDILTLFLRQSEKKI